VGDASASTVENRSEGRSNVFLTAMLDGAGTSTPVRIRNISARGVLVDGRGLPPVGTPVRLSRGRFSAAGQLAWAGEGQAGVNFDREIDVASWVQRVVHAGQQRVDGVIAALRTGTRLPRSHDSGADLSLGEISAALDETCERLAQAQGMSVEFAEELIKLDSLAQSLRRLATSTAIKQP
jgi:hypothetical protein